MIAFHRDRDKDDRRVRFSFTNRTPVLSEVTRIFESLDELLESKGKTIREAGRVAAEWVFCTAEERGEEGST